MQVVASRLQSPAALSCLSDMRSHPSRLTLPSSTAALVKVILVAAVAAVHCTAMSAACPPGPAPTADFCEADKGMVPAGPEARLLPVITGGGHGHGHSSNLFGSDIRKCVLLGGGNDKLLSGMR
jgi:hypothetical protein